jgi:hypothetical protein
VLLPMVDGDHTRRRLFRSKANILLLRLVDVEVTTGLGRGPDSAPRGAPARNRWRITPLPPTYVAMFLARIDHWLGTTLFVPPIVKLCQLTGQSQYAVSRLLWFVAALDGLYRADTLVSALVFGAMSVFMMVTASLRADWPTRSSMVFRLLALVFLAMDVAQGAAKGQWAGVEFWIVVLAAEYAASIRTIPPRVARKAKAARSRTTGTT